jgi:hypothetical protein
MERKGENDEAVEPKGKKEGGQKIVLPLPPSRVS